MASCAPKKIDAPTGKPRDAPRKCASATRAATARDGAKAQSAGKAMPTAKASGCPLHPVAPVAAPPATNRMACRTLRREGEDFPCEAEDTVGRKRPKIS